MYVAIYCLIISKFLKVSTKNLFFVKSHLEDVSESINIA